MRKSTIKLTLPTGEDIRLQPAADFNQIDPFLPAILLFNDGNIARGYANGAIDQEGCFVLKTDGETRPTFINSQTLLAWANISESTRKHLANQESCP